MEKKFRMWYGDESYRVDSFEDIIKWFKERNCSTPIRYKGGLWCDKSKEWGKEWKKAYIINYYDEKNDNLYLDVLYTTFLDENYIVNPTKVSYTLTISHT